MPRSPRIPDHRRLWCGRGLALALLTLLSTAGRAENNTSPSSFGPPPEVDTTEAAEEDAAESAADKAEGEQPSVDKPISTANPPAPEVTSLAFLDGLSPSTPKAEILSQVLLDQLQESGLEVVAAPNALTAGGCADALCLISEAKAAKARYGVIGAITQNGAVDLLQLSIVDVSTGVVVGRSRDEGRGETSYIQQANVLTTRLLASAALDKAPGSVMFFGVLSAGTALVVDDKKPLGRRFPVLSLAGGTVAGVGVLLLGVGVLFGITANANQASAVASATQVEAAAYLDQRDVNAFFANGLLFVGTAVAIGGAATLGLGLAWGE